MSVHAASQALGATDEDVAARGRSRVWTALRRDPSFWIGLTAAVLIIGAAILAPLLAPHDPDQQFRATGRTPQGDPVGPSAAVPARHRHARAGLPQPVAVRRAGVAHGRARGEPHRHPDRRRGRLARRVRRHASLPVRARRRGSSTWASRSRASSCGSRMRCCRSRRSSSRSPSWRSSGRASVSSSA